MVGLRDIFAGPAELTRLEPEELGGVLVEVITSSPHQGGFTPSGLAAQCYSVVNSWPGDQRAVHVAIAEAVNWLVSQGLAMLDPNQTGRFYMLTRRGCALRSRTDVEAYRKGNDLPLQLLQPGLAEKVHSMFVRGDHVVAVLQAFKDVEVAVRNACGYSNDLVGHKLMAKAFSTTDGPLADMTLVEGERQAEFYLFAGAMGHCKNPASHRDIELEREEAARLIVFASHLLAIVEERARKLAA